MRWPAVLPWERTATHARPMTWTSWSGMKRSSITGAGLVTLRVPLIAVGKVRVDLVPIDASPGERKQLLPAVESPPWSEQIPIVPLEALIYMKLKGVSAEGYRGPGGTSQAGSDPRR